jgi:TolB protein
VTHIPAATNGHAKAAWPFAQTPPPTSVQLGLEVVDVITASRRPLFAFSPSEPFLNQFLTFFDQYAKSHSIWSPDSSSLVLSSEVHGQPALQVVDVARNQQRIIASGYMAAWSW